ncbi:unnamed protein product [Thelazia callipaeda]|uniref:PDZ domain-containing protein n=1 Tax=Thelazia callipaeda TaxID=103827 RepID=A0A0N5CSM4_THECL|nr:unnamed protein product [Thelazia callipaeda]
MNGHIWKQCSNEVSNNNDMIACSTNDVESNRLKGYENDIRKRRELYQHRAKEEAFLRDSLRGSRKLQLLENHSSFSDRKLSTGYKNGTLFGDTKIKTGYCNIGYETGNTSGDQFENQKCESIPLEQVILSVNRVARHLDKREGREEDSKLLRDFFMQKPVQTAIEISNIRSTNKILSSSNFLPYYHETIESQPTSSADLSNTENDAQNIIACTRMQGDLKIVKVTKSSNSYLGATVRNEGEKVIVGRVIRGGMAERSNLLVEGDELIEANGNDLRGKNIMEVCDILRSISGELSLVVVPSSKAKSSDQIAFANQVRHFRALFDYDPEVKFIS